MTTQTTARELFQTADESRYTWDEKFPGYSADVQLSLGSEIYTGKIRINQNLSIEVIGVADEEVQAGIYTQLWDLVSRCQRSSFEQSHANHEFTLLQTDETGAVEILEKGDSISLNYKIKDNLICQETRIMGRMAFVIDIHENLDTGFGYIPTRYNGIFRNSKTNEVTNILEFQDIYEKIGNYYIITLQIVQECKDGVQTTTEFSYSNLKLLELVVL